MPGEIETIYQLFARLLDYPTPGLSQAALECSRRIEPYSTEAALLLSSFGDFSQAVTLGCLEEAYTRAFDLNAAFQPYVGYHLFGDTYNRSPFLLGLSNLYRQHGFSAGKELPDHLTVVLRFLAHCQDQGMRAELIQEALLPALQRMNHPQRDEEREDEETDLVAELDSGQNLYQPLLEALEWLLQAVSTMREDRLINES